MCGIAGIYAYHEAAPDAQGEELLRISDALAARGPDGSGEWFSPDLRVGLAHRRLAIIDLSERGSQPMQSAKGHAVITFNGQIYNYRELRRKLEAKGRVFRSQSDTEVLLHLYAETGQDMVKDLRGMFAFALWDARRQGLFLARDPYGIKPLYFADDGRTFRCASQVKALLAGGQLSKARDPAGVAGFYLFGSVPEPFTINRDIRSLEAGATLWVDKAGPRDTRTYFSIPEVFCRAEADALEATPADRLRSCREALAESLRYHLVSDVPVGVFLSSGIDSGALLGLIRDVSQDDIRSVTLKFEEFAGSGDDEAPIAAQVANHYRARHATRLVRPEEFCDDLKKIVMAMDQPSIDGINTWFVSKAASELGLKVAMSGLGGDELFGGYPSFLDIPRWARLFWLPTRVPALGRSLSSICRLARRAWPAVNPKTPALFELAGSFPGAYLVRRGLFMPSELGALMGTEAAREGLQRLQPLACLTRALTPEPKTAFGRVAVLEASLYLRNQLLRDADWAGMAHSLEVRVPLVDSVLLRKLAPVLVHTQMRNRKSMLGMSPGTPLPRSVLHKVKTGFQTPMEDWLNSIPDDESGPQDLALIGTRHHWSRRWALHLMSLQPEA